ncbi:MAG: hypothetical protein RL196_1143 [Actinomycetota bacterium]|jgi:hypothetical protein
MTNLNAFIFFLVGAVSLAVVAMRFIATKNFGFRMFGIGLNLLATAFAVWSIIVGSHPTDLAPLTTVGVIPFGAANLFFVAAGTSDFKPATRRNLLVVATVVIGVLFVIRTFVSPSQPSFSDTGLFYFNADPAAILLYVIVFAGALMPAVHVVTKHIAADRTAIFTRLFFNAVTLSAVVLLVSKDDELQNWNGNVLLAALIGLLVVHARKSPAYIAR